MDKVVTNALMRIIRFRYEYFGEDIRSLATDYEVPSQLLEHAVERDNWRAQNLPISLDSGTTPTDLRSLSENMLEATKVKGALINALNQQVLNPKYLEAEHAILDKLIKVTNSISVNADNAGTQMKALVGALKDLQERQSVLSVLGSQDDQNKDTGRLVVQIVNQVSN